MKVFDRLNNWFSRPGVPSASPEPPYTNTVPLGSMASEIEAFHWGTLLDDMDRFSMSFDQHEDRIL
ncbi:MAG TPA: hypothetical protein VJU83_08270 [Burkholderiales bacterium]|nr:hypothetical protein [Burkholderiales bacterium]